LGPYFNHRSVQEAVRTTFLRRRDSFRAFGFFLFPTIYFMAKGRLEVFKFSLYLVVPVTLVYLFNRPDAFEWMIDRTRYVVYPPEESRDKMQRHLAEVEAMYKKK